MDRVEQLYVALVRRPGLPQGLQHALKLGAVTVRELVRDQVQVRAATLAFWTLVALVPVLVLAVALVRPLGLEHAVPVRDLLFRSLLAGPVSEVGATLDAWIEQVDFGKLGIAGVAGLALAGSRIFFSVEEAYNRLWNVRVRRTFAIRMVLFYATVTLAPVLVSWGFLLTARLRGAVDTSTLDFALPVLLTTAGFVAAIRALPDTEVRWGPACIGGLVSAVLFETAKQLFSYYVELVGASRAAAAIYGSLGLFPVFLLWLFVLWNIVLLGVELAYVVQRRDDLLDAEDRRLAGPEHRRRIPDGLFALQCMLVVVRRFMRKEGPTPEPEVTRALHSDPAAVYAALETLEEAGLLAESPQGYLPSAPVTETTARELLQRYRELTRPDHAADAPGALLVGQVLGERGGALDHSLAELAGR
jgi:membrane protein